MAKFTLRKLHVVPEMSQEAIDISCKAGAGWKELVDGTKRLNLHISATVTTDEFGGLTIDGVNDAIHKLLSNVEI